MSNKTLFTIHSWCGLNLGFLLFVICLSGTIATVSFEIDWLLDRDFRSSLEPSFKQGSSTPVPLAVAYQKVQRSYPQANIYAVRKNPEGYLAIQFYLKDRDKGNLTVFVDPYNGALLAERDRLSIKNFFRIFHKQLFIADTQFTVNGVLIVGLFGFPLLLTLLSGLFFMGGWLKKLVRLRWHKGLRVFMTDWHRSTGLWALVFSLLFALTGTWYWLEKVTGISEVQLVEHNGVQYQEQSPLLSAPDLDLYIRKAEEALPGLEVNGFFLPGKPGQPAHVFGQAEAVMVRDAGNYVALDPYSGEVLTVREATELGVLDRWLHTVDPLHFGSFGGLWTKGIWFFFGLLLTVSIPVGGYIWYSRIQVSKSKNGVGIGRVEITKNVLGILVLTLSMVFSSIGMLRMKAGAQATHNLTFEFHQLGPWHAALQHKLNDKTGNVGTFELLFKEARPNIKAAHLHIKKRGEPEAAEFAFTLDWNAQRALTDFSGLALENITYKQAIGRWYDGVESLWITLEDQQGDIYRHHFTRAEIARALTRISPVASEVKSHMPVQVFIIGFLIFIWLLLGVWVICCTRVYRRHANRKTSALETNALDDNSASAVAGY